MFEIDVDIGRLAAMARDEAFEHHADHVGGNIRDPKQIAQDRIGGRAAALTEDAPRPGELHDVLHGQEIGRIAQIPDQAEFLGQQLMHPLGRALRVTPGQSLLRQPFQPGLRRFRVVLAGVIVAEFRKVKGATRGNFQRAADRGGVVTEKPRHLGWAFQAALGIGQRPGADGVDGQPLAQAGQHIGQGAAGGAVHQHIAHRHHRRRGPQGQIGAAAKPSLIGAVIARRGAEKHMAGKLPLQPLQGRQREGQIGRRQGDQDHPGPARGQIVKAQGAVALARPALAKGEQLREPLIGRTVGGQGQKLRRAIAQGQPRADDQPRQIRRRGAKQGRGGREGLARGGIGSGFGTDAQSLGFLPQGLQRRKRPHHPGQRIAVGDGDGGQPQFGGPGHQLLGVGGAGEEGEIRRHAEFCISGGILRIWTKKKAHANSPCTNQPGFCGVKKSQSRRPSAVSTRQ